MKLLLGIISLIFCTGLGYYLSIKYSLRREFYQDFNDFNKNLKSEISFAQNSLINIIKKYSDKKTLFYNNLKDSLIDKKKPSLDKNVFTQEERVFFQDYLDNIGASDKNTQMTFLQSTEIRISDMLNKTQSEEKKYKSLYIKMGFLIGLVALIILI